VSALFTINFRRETYLKEVARARRRVIALGVWVAYFGVLVIVLGLYGLNCVSLARRAAQLERHASRVSQNDRREEWRVSPDALAEVERAVDNPIRWRNRLMRLSQLIPPNARLTSVAANPDNVSGIAEQNRLMISGEYKIAQGQDRMRGVVAMVGALRGDSLFSVGYQTIRLVTTRISESSGTVAEFTIECR
jgi:Tfp pilus assembly protein PilN